MHTARDMTSDLQSHVVFAKIVVSAQTSSATFGVDPPCAALCCRRRATRAASKRWSTDWAKSEGRVLLCFAATQRAWPSRLLGRGLIKEEDADCKLHATVWNTRYRDAGTAAQRTACDVRGVMQRFGSHTLGTYAARWRWQC